MKEREKCTHKMERTGKQQEDEFSTNTWETPYVEHTTLDATKQERFQREGLRTTGHVNEQAKKNHSTGQKYQVNMTQAKERLALSEGEMMII